MTDNEQAVQPMVHGQVTATGTTERRLAPERMTPTEVNDSLSGWDELAIKKASGLTLGQLSKDEVHLLRCLAAVVIARRDGVKIEAAYKPAMDMKQGDISDLFEDEPDDVLPDDPDSDVGKDDSQPEPTPTTSLGSSSTPASPPPSTEDSPV